MEDGRPLLVRAETAGPPPWEGAAAAVPLVVRGPGFAPAERAALPGAGCALLDGSGADAVALARAVHAADPALQVVIVAPEGERARI
ncbi:MAG TPA: hypothetical protein VHG91_14325, partial [Longimicrobium sp.]|nr:hypothetical protein [Longimicrobium sp.]